MSGVRNQILIGDIRERPGGAHVRSSIAARRPSLARLKQIEVAKIIAPSRICSSLFLNLFLSFQRLPNAT